MYQIPAELISNFIRYLDDQFGKLLTELHMTEFCTADRSQLIRLVKHLDHTGRDILVLCMYKINGDNAKVTEALKEFESLKSRVNDMVLNEKIDAQVIETLHRANQSLEKLKEKGE